MLGKLLEEFLSQVSMRTVKTGKFAFDVEDMAVVEERKEQYIIKDEL